MSVAALLLAAQVVSVAPPARVCQPAQFRLSLEEGGGFNGMSHAGTALIIRNLGPDCMIPLRFYSNSSLRTELRWVSGPVFARNRSFRATGLSVQVNGTMMHLPLTASLYGQRGKPVFFDQTPLRKADGAAAR